MERQKNPHTYEQDDIVNFSPLLSGKERLKQLRAFCYLLAIMRLKLV